METNDDEIIEQNEIEWIEKRKHDLILRKYRLNTQRLIKEYQTKIQQQNRQIELLMKEMKRQKFIIDTFANVNNETVDNTIQSKTNGISRIETDSESEPILYSIVDETKHEGHKNAKEQIVNSFSQNQNGREIRKMRHRINRIEIERMKPSLVSIEIQPNIQPKNQNSTNIYICDECNKTMSSRRVLAVCIPKLNFILLFISTN